MNVTLIGCGGLGSPVSFALAQSGLVKRMTLVDDDTVDATNLHRQTLYVDGDVGQPKVEVAAPKLELVARATGNAMEVRPVRARFRPDTALSLLEGQDLLVEGADNFATKFLAADAARIAGVPVAHAGAVRWNGWALLSDQQESHCMRCVFEDIPHGTVETCATAGVIGPVVGVLGACQAALCIAHLRGQRAAGTLFHYDGLRGKLRRTEASRRDACPLCNHQINTLDPERYRAPCAA